MLVYVIVSLFKEYVQSWIKIGSYAYTPVSPVCLKCMPLGESILSEYMTLMELCTLYVLACKVIVTIGNSDFCCCVPCYICDLCWVLLTFLPHIALTVTAADNTIGNMPQTQMQWPMFIICSYCKNMGFFFFNLFYVLHWKSWIHFSLCRNKYRLPSGNN